MISMLIKKSSRTVCMLSVVLLLISCSLIDPSNVVNPQTTEENLRAGASGGTVPFLNGVKQNFSQMIGSGSGINLQHEVMSDNYQGNSSIFGGLSTDKIDEHAPNNGSGGYTNPHEVRNLATFTLESVVPSDNLATNGQKALLHFYRGMAHLISAEGWHSIPLDADQPPTNMENRLNLALNDFQAAVGLDSGLETLISLVSARAYRLLGDKANARTNAMAALSSNQPNYVFNAEYDASSLRNRGADLAAASPLEDMQPLPRLDFLDPKYLKPDDPTPVAKMEEAHLILAEIALADGDYESAKQSLANAATLARSRPTVEFFDQDSRKRSDPGLEEPPNTAPILVQASPTSPALPGLAFPRNGNLIQVPTISGTSLNPVEILALPTTTLENRVELLRLIYLARQEIFFFEGRRMTDLGIRRQINESEVLANEVIEESDNAAKIYIPGFFPTPPDEIDRFDVVGNTVIIRYDMNQILADNRNSHFGFDASDVSTALPFQFPF